MCCLLPYPQLRRGQGERPNWDVPVGHRYREWCRGRLCMLLAADCCSGEGDVLENANRRQWHRHTIPWLAKCARERHSVTPLQVEMMPGGGEDKVSPSPRVRKVVA